MAKSLDGVLIKSAHKPEYYSQEQMTEFLQCADPVTGPSYFLEKYFYIQHPVKGKLLYAPYDYQRNLVKSYNDYRFSINLLSRQLGKCLEGDSSRINIRNKQGEEYEIPIGKFYEYQQAKRDGTDIPDISCYKKCKHCSVEFSPSSNRQV